MLTARLDALENDNAAAEQDDDSDEYVLEDDIEGALLLHFWRWRLTCFLCCSPPVTDLLSRCLFPPRGGARDVQKEKGGAQGNQAAAGRRPRAKVPAISPR